MQSGRLHFHPKREKTWGQHKNRDLQVREQACCLLSEKLKVYKTVEKNHASCDDCLQLCLVMVLHLYEIFVLLKLSHRRNDRHLLLAAIILHHQHIQYCIHAPYARWQFGEDFTSPWSGNQKQLLDTCYHGIWRIKHSWSHQNLLLCLHLDQTAKRLKGNSNRPIFSFSYNSEHTAKEHWCKSVNTYTVIQAKFAPHLFIHNHHECKQALNQTGLLTDSKLLELMTEFKERELFPPNTKHSTTQKVPSSGI